MSKKNKAWRIWAKALGAKESSCHKEADRVALVRTFIFASYLATNVFIISGVARHWNDASRQQEGAISCLKATKKGA